MDNNFKFPMAFASKRKKLEAFDGLPKFSWDEITSQEVIGQGSFGAVFITQYQHRLTKRTISNHGRDSC